MDKKKRGLHNSLLMKRNDLLKKKKSIQRQIKRMKLLEKKND